MSIWLHHPVQLHTNTWQILTRLPPEYVDHLLFYQVQQDTVLLKRTVWTNLFIRASLFRQLSRILQWVSTCCKAGQTCAPTFATFDKLGTFLQDRRHCRCCCCCCRECLCAGEHHIPGTLCQCTLSMECSGRASCSKYRMSHRVSGENVVHTGKTRNATMR